MTKKEYLESELWTMSWGAAVRPRGGTPVYIKPHKDEESKEFQRKVKAIADKIIATYKTSQVSQEHHIKNIEKLSREGTKKGQELGILYTTFRVGIAQKLLNLHLKYLWCAGIIKHTPPHCPIDSIILQKVKRELEHAKLKEISWTSIDSIAKYKRIIGAVQSHVGLGNSIAKWELAEYARRK